MINFQFKGSLAETVPTIVASLLYIYLAYIIIKNIRKKQNIKEAIIPIAIYIIVIAIVGAVSIISPILYARYLFTITGLLIFAISYLLAKEDNKFIIGIICGAVLVMSFMNLMVNIEDNYDSSNQEVINYLKEILKKDDVMAYSSIENGGVIAALIDANHQYFVNFRNWSVEEAYKAYAPQMETVNSIEDVQEKAKGRIIIVDTEDLELYNKVQNKEIYKNIYIEKFNTRYKNYTYQIVVLEK